MQLNFFGTKHASQCVFDSFKCGGVCLDGGSTAEVEKASICSMADSECAIVMHENLERVGRFRTLPDIKIKFCCPRSLAGLIWFLGRFPLDPTQLYFISAKHESQSVFNAFKFGGVLLDKSFTTEVSEGFHIQHS
jgi:hypothetical protein